MRTRYDHPELRRFMNADPIGFDAGFNWHVYAEGNSISGMNPSGLAKIPASGSRIGANHLK